MEFSQNILDQIEDAMEQGASRVDEVEGCDRFYLKVPQPWFDIPEVTKARTITIKQRRSYKQLRLMLETKQNPGYLTTLVILSNYQRSATLRSK